MSKFLSVICAAALVLFVGNLMQAPAIEPAAVVVPAPTPAPVPDDQGSVVVPVIEIGCPGGVCPLPRRANTDCSTCPDSKANGGDCEASERRPAARAVAVPIKVAGRAVCAPARLVRGIFGRRR